MSVVPAFRAGSIFRPGRADTTSAGAVRPRMRVERIQRAEGPAQFNRRVREAERNAPFPENVRKWCVPLRCTHPANQAGSMQDNRSDYGKQKSCGRVSFIQADQ